MSIIIEFKSSLNRNKSGGLVRKMCILDAWVVKRAKHCIDQNHRDRERDNVCVVWICVAV